MSFSMKTRLTCSAAMNLLALLYASEAQARCVTTGTTVICDANAPNPETNGASGTQITVLSGATVQLDDPFAGASVRTSTIGVNPSGSLLTQSGSQIYDVPSTGFTAVALNNGASANIAGTVTARGTAGIGISLATNASVTVASGGIVETTGNGSNFALQNTSAAIAVTGINTAITVNGVVRSAGNNAPAITTTALGLFGATSNPATVTVGSSGSVTTAGASSTAIALSSGSSLSVAGTVSARGANSAAVTYQAGTTGPLTVSVLVGGSITASSAPAIAITGTNAVGVTNSLTNAGIIASSGGTAIQSAGATTLDNSGVISGANGVAVQLGAANDAVTLRNGSSITGAIVGGGGTDTATLVGTSATATTAQQVASFTGFDRLTVQSGYWTASAANPSALATLATINSNATLDIANGANGLVLTAPSVVDNGLLVVRGGSASAGSTFGASVVTGTGGVLFTGAGIATLDGTNSLQNTGTNTVDTGSTLLVTGTQGGGFVNNGTVQIGTGGTAGNLTGSLADNGTLIVNRAGDYTFTGALTGTGIFVQQGTGRVIFGSNYAFSGVTQLQGGVIRFAAPIAATTMLDVEGTGQIDMSRTNQTIAQLVGGSTTVGINIDGGSLTVNQANNTSFAGSIVGNGSLIKTGTGSLNLTGLSTYAGSTTISAGRLAVNGSIISPVTVNSGGTLGGNGTVGSATIASGGTFAPGNSIGTMTVAGNLTFAAGSIYQVEANAAGAADRINATGTATLTGGTVQVLAATGIYAPLTSYTILTAAGGVSGRFASITSNMAFLTPFLSYGANAVTLQLGRNDISFASQATTANGVAVANAVAARGLGDTVYTAVLVQTATGAGQAFNRLSGEIHVTIPTAMIDSDRRVRDAIMDRARIAQGDGLGIWMQGLDTYAYSRDQAQAFGFHTNRIGVYGGVDYALGGFRIGVSGGYFDDKLRVPALASRAEIETDLIGGSISYAALGGRLNATAGATHAWHHVSTTRIVDTPGLAGSYIASYMIKTTQAFGELGYDLLQGPVALTPFIRYDYDRSRADGFNELGGVAALNVAAERRHNEFGTVGARIAASYPIGGGLSIEPHASAAYLRTWDRLYSTRIETIGGTGPAFGVTGDRLGRDNLDANGGIDIVVSTHIRIGATGYVTRSSEWRDHGGKGSVSVRF